jgi:hypothetical protein
LVIIYFDKSNSTSQLCFAPKAALFLSKHAKTLFEKELDVSAINPKYSYFPDTAAPPKVVE